MILDYYTMEDVDKETLRKYRQIFEIRNEGHVWNSLDDKSFLEKLGGYRKDRREGREGLTLAGLLMFGDGLAIRDEFDNVFMDYRDESEVTPEIRWNDRITYDGTWENNLFNFFTKVTPKLVADLKKPFLLDGIQRIDETSVHKAVREAFVNLIIHADYLLDAGTLKVIKCADGFEFTNPGILKLPIEDIYRGGNSKTRNPRMQTMLRMVGFGDNAGSGFPAILSTWKLEGWIEPELREDTKLNQVTLTLKTVPIWVSRFQELRGKWKDRKEISAAEIDEVVGLYNDLTGMVLTENVKDKNMSSERLITYALYMVGIMNAEIRKCVGSKEVDYITDSEMLMMENIVKHLKKSTEPLTESAETPGESAEKSAETPGESAEKSAETQAESANSQIGTAKLSKRHKQILVCMKQGQIYSSEEIAQMVGLKGSRVRQLLYELAEMKLISCTAATKNRRYSKNDSSTTPIEKMY